MIKVLVAITNFCTYFQNVYRGVFIHIIHINPFISQVLFHFFLFLNLLIYFCAEWRAGYKITKELCIRPRIC